METIMKMKNQRSKSEGRKDSNNPIGSARLSSQTDRRQHGVYVKNVNTGIQDKFASSWGLFPKAAQKKIGILIWKKPKPIWGGSHPGIRKDFQDCYDRRQQYEFGDFHPAKEKIDQEIQ
jgi:hypothetical protein